jgi:glycosyltransferase involved in cell wall biosynthesis
MASAGSRRRVLIIVQNLPVPFDRRVWLEATTLAAAGYAVSVICPKAKGFNRSFEVLEGIRIHRYPLPIDASGALGFISEFLWCFVRTIMKVVRVAAVGGGFDAIHVCNPPETYWPLGWVCRALGKRFLFDHHDLSPEMYQAKFDQPSRLVRRALLAMERETFRAAHVVVTTNGSHAQVARTRGRKRDEDIFIVRSGPDLTRLTRDPRDPQWHRGKRHLLVYLGEICKQDGADHLVRAVRELRDGWGRDDVHCVFVGGGPHQPVIRAYATEIGVADLCTFTGRVSDELLCRILSSADVAVDPDPLTAWSNQSTMNKIMEYMFFGLPIVAYDLAEHRVSAQSAAIYAEANDERRLAAEISGLLDDPRRRAEMAAFGRRRLEDHLAWQHSAPVLLEAYRRLFDGAPARPVAVTAEPRPAPVPAKGTPE